MDSVNPTQNKNLPEKTHKHQYNWQHMVFVTKYRYKMFRNPKTVDIIRRALYDVSGRYGMTIKELAFGDDFAHIHLEIDVPNTITVSYAVQLLKGFSSYTVFKEMPDHRKRYWGGNFWSPYYSNGSVGPNTEETVKNYIRRQDVSDQIRQRTLTS
jgi:REP element-mobilizing transposase RayT